MKTIKFLTAVFTILLAGNVYGATLYYTPQQIDLAIPAGYEDSVQFSVGITGSTYIQWLWFINEVNGGNLPSGWLSSNPATGIFSAPRVSTTTLGIRVPEGTLPGVYSGYIKSKAKSMHMYADPGAGIFLNITVPARCTAIPDIQIYSTVPEYLWPPNHSITDVIFSGRATVPEGCTLQEIGYSIDDEYGKLTSTGSITVDGGGSFNLALPLEASRHGNDRDGRLYSVTLFAKDEAGIIVLGPAHIIVPHDQRDHLR